MRTDQDLLHISPPEMDNGIAELSRSELQDTLRQCVRIAHEDTHGTKIYLLKTMKLVDKNSKLKSVRPILDDMRLPQVEGRLQNADMSYEEKDQLILPPNHHLTRLVVQLKVNPAQQLMGDLPHSYVEAVRPFFSCRIDYTGSFYVKTGSQRSKLKERCYVVLFVCLATRAMHLEVVGKMMTEAFLLDLRRFISRRGRCQNPYSDNGKKFVGARQELSMLQAAVSSDYEQTQVKSFMNEQGIDWHFFPPVSPRFGGIWVAGVKPFKYHLRRMIGTICPTFEELTTLTCHTEALTPLLCNPTDPQALILGYFLI
ncbi:uncharacterized protein LOC126193790 [Schistocerca nitens]|uniref:uncharacterized protein LOC126193790 n=1 Tax=Schistocerca nitens TaxID=7011 RepID=UPI00211754DB|nr:uncharacterized protein LOC126193790 [Schistocerca nitens]